MTTYRYKAKDAQGGIVESTIEAESRQEVLSMLRAKGLTTISLISNADENTDPKNKKTRSPKKRGLHVARVTLTDMTIFCRQLSISVNAGVPLRESLESIHEDMDNPTMKRVLGDVLAGLHRGSSFSDALALHPKIFTPIFVGLVKAAEESGALAQTLDQLAFYLERTEKLQRKIKSIMAYPAFVAGFFVVVCLVMALAILPRFQEIFSGYGSNLPKLTQIVFGINQFFIDNVWYILGTIIALVVALILYRRSPKGRRHTDAIILKVPFFGTCLQKFIIARFCRSLSIMVKGGVPIAHAFEVTAAVTGNKVLEEALMTCREQIIAGAGIASSIEDQKLFPRLLIRMIAVGEDSGKLPEVLEKVSDVYENQVEGSIMVSTALAEPIVICVFGVLVLVLVASIYLPIFTVATRMR
ncbi:type II secretion system F family protein [Verrucomicrobiota bacterium]